MLIKVNRDNLRKKSTIGKFYIDDEYFCYSLEDTVRAPGEEKIYGETAIPAGRYKVILRTTGTIHEAYKKRFGEEFHHGTLWIRDIPGFEYVLIHCGNTAADTLGCILVGALYNPENPDKITSSEVAYRRIYPIISAALLHGDDVEIEVI